MPATTHRPMPALFLGHGSPMNAIEENRYTQTWRALGANLPRPRAVLVISAHWYLPSTRLTTQPAPPTIHDFYGFPQALFDIRYPAPGLPALLPEVATAIAPIEIHGDADAWGLDHGAWSVLLHLFPHADIPVLQLSLDSRQPADWHFRLGQRLAVLRQSGILLLGSGNVVHNLRALDMRMGEAGFDWAERFDQATREIAQHAPAQALHLLNHPDYHLAAPTAEHFLPFLYIAGVASQSGQPMRSVTAGHVGGSISMSAFSVGL